MNILVTPEERGVMDLFGGPTSFNKQCIFEKMGDSDKIQSMIQEKESKKDDIDKEIVILNKYLVYIQEIERLEAEAVEAAEFKRKQSQRPVIKSEPEKPPETSEDWAKRVKPIYTEEVKEGRLGTGSIRAAMIRLGFSNKAEVEAWALSEGM